MAPTRSVAAAVVESLAVPRLWPGATFVIIGGGPSLIPSDVEFCRGRARVIAVNDAYRLAPWADALYAFDWAWWQHHADALQSFLGLKYSMRQDIALKPEWGVTQLQMGAEYGLSSDPTTLNHGKNGVFQAMNLAVHLGAKKIRLLGVDMQKGDDGRTHWFGDHPSTITKRTKGPCFDYWKTCFQSLERPLSELGIEVVNCSRRTALKVWPPMSLEEAL